METVLQRILSLLTLPPGNLIVHLVLVFSVLASLQAALIGRRSSQTAHSGRLIFGLAMLLLGQLVLFLSSGLAWQGLLNPHLVLPPLDRAIMLFSLVWIVWMWNFPQPARLGDLVTGFLNLGIVLLFLFTFTGWSAEGAEAAFNHSWNDWTWELAALFVVITGMAVMLFSRPDGWQYGFGMLAISMAGLVAHLLLVPQNGDFSGLIRLSQLAAFPLLPTLLYRFHPTNAQPRPLPSTQELEQDGSDSSSAAIAPQTAVTVVKPGDTSVVRQERRRYSSDPRTVHAWLALKNETDPAKLSAAVAKAISHTMLADMAFIVTGPVFGQLILHNGYDLVREDNVEGAALEPSQTPTLSNALQRGKTVRINASDTQSNDLHAISSVLGLKDIASLMVIPLMVNGKPWGGIMLLSPYSNRQWTLEDQSYLASEMPTIAEILYSAQATMENSLGTPRTEDVIMQLQTDLANVRQENERLAAERNEVRRQFEAQPASADPNLNALVALQQDAQNTITELKAENERMRTMLQEVRKNSRAGASTSSEGLSEPEARRLQSDLRATLQELAHLQNELAKSNAALLMFERQVPPGQAAAEDHEVIVAISQEIRQPLSSILGYTDLLLTESVGLLGTLQRKYLEHVRTSAERMRSILDDLVQVAALGNGALELMPKPVDLATIMDGAIADTSAQLREKNITLRVDLPADMPRIFADRDAIQQIVVHLLQNAGAVSPNEGAVIMRARIQHENQDMYLLMNVTDSGGGIDPELLTRVFNRRYRADKPLIEGLGDTGVGLSIAKTLVEAHGGRIWVDTEPGQSTTFSVLLPIHPDPAEFPAENSAENLSENPLENPLQ